MKKRSIRVILTMFLLLAAFSTVTVQATEQVSAAATVKKGWKTVGGKKYYIKANGQHRTGWFNYNGKRYYLDPKADGAVTIGLKKISGKNYIFNKYGYLVRDKKYYLVGKKYYAIDANGVATKLTNVEQQAVRQLKKLSSQKLRNAFDWAAKLPYQAISTKGKTPGGFASYGFTHNRGDCNVQACVFYYMARVLQYDAHFVKGTVPQANGKDGNHAWVEIKIGGKTYVFDPNLAGQYASVYGKNTGWKFQYGDKHTYKYQNITRVN